MFKNINEIKNFPSASREWKNSVYSYNEDTTINAPHNDVMANTIVNMVLHLAPHEKINTKSKRMRDLIRKSTTRQLIVSKPDIKQTSEKAIITAYIFDREKTMYVRKLFFVKNSLDKSTINDLYKDTVNNNIDNIDNNLLSLDNTNELSIDGINNKNLSLIKLKKKLLNRIKKHNIDRYVETSSKKRINKRLKRLFMKKLSYRYKINNRVFSRIFYKSLLNNKSILNNVFMLKFLKWLISYFNIDASYYSAGKTLTIMNASRIARTVKIKNNILILAHDVLRSKTDKVYNINNYVKIYKIPKMVPLLQIRLINKVLLSHIKIMMVYYIDDIIKLNTGIRKMFDLYKNKYLISHAKLYLRKQKLALSYLVKLYNNKLKYNNLIHGFKWLLGSVYNKDIKLNLVNLKYLHLNSDIFSEAVSIKLRKKNNKLLRILKKALKLVKLPKIISHSPDIQKITKFSSFDWSMANKDLNENNVLKVKPVNDILDNLLFNMFPSEISYDKQQLAHNIIYSIKHKWVRGARLEAKGRLTRRYTASRSVFKFRYKGSLRNLEHLKKPNFTREQVSVFMMRNSIRPNVQYTFTASRKRIGVYGIKGWISGY